MNFKHVYCFKVDHEYFFKHKDVAVACSSGGVRGEAGCVGHLESRTEGISVVVLSECLVKLDTIEGLGTVELKILLLVVACWTDIIRD